jgi:virulence-associated protein VapD
LTDDTFKNERKQGSLYSSMKVIVEVGYRSEKVDNKKYILSSYSKSISDVVELLIEKEDDKYVVEMNLDDLVIEFQS